MAFAVLPIRAIHGEEPAFGWLGDFTENEAGDSVLGQDAGKEEALEPSVAAFVFGAGEIFGRQEGEVHGALSEQADDEQSEAFKAREVEIEVGIKLTEEMVVKHPNFGRRLAMQAFSRLISFIFNALPFCFLSCSVKLSEQFS
jgi:hypothetical protein